MLSAEFDQIFDEELRKGFQHRFLNDFPNESQFEKQRKLEIDAF